VILPRPDNRRLGGASHRSYNRDAAVAGKAIAERLVCSSSLAELHRAASAARLAESLPGRSTCTERMPIPMHPLFGFVDRVICYVFIVLIHRIQFSLDLSKQLLKILNPTVHGYCAARTFIIITSYGRNVLSSIRDRLMTV
jgi:hypothetical protein